MEVRKTGCCGILELVDISTLPTPLEVLTAAVPDMVGACAPCAHLRRKPYTYFTSVTKRVQNDHASRRTDNYGLALRDYIREHKLGTVGLGAPPMLNWTGNTLNMFIWTVDWDALHRWYTTTTGKELEGV